MANLETATLGGGCFWCLEAVYQEMEGIESIVSGYMGGHVENPTYKQVCTARTGHAEVAQLKFDASVTTFRDVLEVFFTIHDPTTKDRQGNDVGSQYRSVIFFHTSEQQSEAEKIIADLTHEDAFPSAIVTEVVPAVTFYPAEDSHQNYYADNSKQPYCMFVVSPKLKKFRENFKAKRRVTT
ncbi:MAG: peptide-methionine (S)-S-oxide reductase MsrA [Bryobacteraceae bacterium]|nr:peptide-methionine (S)-S-oxide reductase MsrA [Bryobacteraceae bacterium]